MGGAKGVRQGEADEGKGCRLIQGVFERGVFMKYKHHECSMCENTWDSDEYMDKCPFCGSEEYIEQSESDYRKNEDYYCSEEE